MYNFDTYTVLATRYVERHYGNPDTMYIAVGGGRW